jgi:hypothetical protein
MKLRFIGADGSMGLKHGEIYEVNLGNTYALITVYWMDKEGYATPCYYSSPQSFAKNWEAV